MSLSCIIYELVVYVTASDLDSPSVRTYDMIVVINLVGNVYCTDGIHRVQTHAVLLLSVKCALT